MPVDPQVKALLDQLEQMGRQAYADLTPEEARAQFKRGVRMLGGTPEPVANFRGSDDPQSGGRP